jgi:predicted TPR repeat methyltransferase
MTRADTNHAAGARERSADYYRSLGESLRALGRIAEAAKAYRQWLSSDPDSAVARHLLAGCTGLGVPDRASSEFIRREFDHFADRFDSTLADLDYQGLALLEHALAEVPVPPAGRGDILDAGCGTGLCGPLLRARAGRLVGVDLSGKMLEKARQRSVYDDLIEADLTAFLTTTAAAFDVIVASDSLVYFGALVPVLRSAAAALRSGGALLFTLELEGEEAVPGFRLHPHGRYSHTTTHVREAVAAAGLALSAMRVATLRRECLRSVPGLVVTTRRP